ncbi:MAG: transposase [Desulfacinum sp.]|nr:transposase [Desulfacinum sp.]
MIALYEKRGLSEQFHSEIKTDLDLERLPSGKFATNALVLTLGGFAYKILRILGQNGLWGRFSPVRHPVKRRRVRTVIQELMYLAARVIRTGRRLKLQFVRHGPTFRAFRRVYLRFCPA